MPKIYIDTPHTREPTSGMRYLGAETGSTYSCLSKWERNGSANELGPSELWSAFHRVTWPYMRVNICHGCQLSSTNAGVSPSLGPVCFMLIAAIGPASRLFVVSFLTISSVPIRGETLDHTRRPVS